MKDNKYAQYEHTQQGMLTIARKRAVNHQQRGARQGGFVMMSVLVLMLLLLLFVGYVSRAASLEQGMVTIAYDHSNARANAELALRDAERDILGLDFLDRYCVDSKAKCSSAGKNLAEKGLRPRAADDDLWQVTNLNKVIGDSLNTGMYDGADYDVESCGKPLWQAVDWHDDLKLSCNNDSRVAIPYGSRTGASFEQGDHGVDAPRYVIEAFRGSDVNSSGEQVIFRITAIGFGKGASRDGVPNHVFLQSLFLAYSNDIK